MYKVFFSSFMLLSAATHADNTPTFDFATGVLSMAYVSASQGIYTATLQIDPSLPATTFKIIAVDATGIASDTTTPPSFDFNTGLLKLPKVNTSQGVYTATLQLTQNLFKLTGADPAGSPGSSKIGGCSVFPANNAWNTAIDALPLHPSSAAWISSISSTGLHPDFGNVNGQPFNLVAGSQVPNHTTFTFDVPSESDLGPYPIPTNFLREDTSDNRLFIIDSETCKLYETYNAQNTGTQWKAKRGAIWDMKSNALRKDGWGSADEGGFPTVPGLVRYDEVVTGTINHALRFTFPKPNSRIWPARHLVETPVNSILPMGARLRLRSNFDTTNFAPELKVILQAMKTYGIILTDDGSKLYLSGTPDERWNDDTLGKLREVKGSDFEAVNSECMQVNPDSGEADPNKCR